MSIGISDEHVELATSLRKWAAGVRGSDAVRAAEQDPGARFDEVWAAAREQGLPTIGLPESAGGGGGSVLDVAVALEACAYGLVPGPLLGSAVAVALLGESAVAGELGEGAVVGLVLDGLVWDAPSATHLLLADGPDWYVVPRENVTLVAALGPDLTRRFGALVDASADRRVPAPGLTTALVRHTAVTLAAAEASGIARWCLETAVDYAGVREQFGAKIGSFQAIKHLCAEMLETAESVTAVAWDVASVARTGSAGADDDQWAWAADVAGAVALDGAVANAQACIQVLGGIGFTFEHDAHFYLRRAIMLRSLLGPTDSFAATLVDLAETGVRRKVQVDLDGRDDAVRDDVRRRVTEIAVRPEPEQRAALVESGYLTPHWPEPYGLAADPVTQLVIDEELAAAGIERPDLKIGGWAAPTILDHGTDEQRKRFVRPTLLGELTWCQLFSEPGAGSDLASLRTRATRTDGGWRLTGQKVWTSLAHDADWAVCLARTDAGLPQHRGITYFLVDMSADGIDVRPLREITGDAMFNEVFLDDVFVPDDCVVAEPGDGWKLARTTLANERVAMASSKLGLSTERAVELADAASPTERVRIGRAIALATVGTLLGVRSTLRSLADRGPGAESSVAKLIGVRTRQESSELVVDLLGPRVAFGGEEVDRDVHEMLMTRCLSIAGGTTQILRNIVAERILGLPR